MSYDRPPRYPSNNDVFRHGRWHSPKSQREEYDRYWHNVNRQYELSKEPRAPAIEGTVLDYFIVFGIILILCIGMYSFYATVMKQGYFLLPKK